MAAILKIETVSGKPTTNFIRAFSALVDSGVEFLVEGTTGVLYCVAGIANNAATLLPSATDADECVRGITLQLPQREAVAQ